jgi:hypothetical protein
MAERNAQMVDLNRLPFIILGWTFLSMSIMVALCFLCAYYDDLVLWARRRLGNRNRNDFGFELRNLLA